jgi:hypothetical protein
MKKFTVEVQRTAYRITTIHVEAEDQKKAEIIALEKASSADFSDEIDYDYEIGFVEEDE